MTKEMKSVSLDEFLNYVMKKWMTIIICVILGCLFSVMGAKICDNTITVPADEEYSELKEQESYFENYMDDSLIMKMDPFNIYERTIYINEFKDRNALKDYVE